MELPSAELLAPGPIAPSVAALPPDATVVALSGQARDLADLGGLSRLESVWISGVSDVSARALGRARRLHRLVIHDLRAADFTPFADLSHLQYLAVAGSPGIKSLTGIDRLAALTSLVLFDCCGYSSLEPLSRLGKLETLSLEGGWSKPLRVESLAPLARLSELRALRLASLQVGDKSLRPLQELRRLRQVFIAKVFAPAEFRALAAALPEARGEFVDTYRDGRG
jgi:hypothetical protein